MLLRTLMAVDVRGLSWTGPSVEDDPMTKEANVTLFDRTWSSLRQVLRDITVRRSDNFAPRADLPDDDAEVLRDQMQACLDARGGEVSARARAASLGRAYLALDKMGRERYLRILAEDFDVDRVAVDIAADRVKTADTPDERRRAEEGLRVALQAPRVRLLTQFNALPDGVKFLVDLRAELMDFAKDDPALRGLEADLRRLLSSWFDVGFLELRRITWRSPAILLEKLIVYEAVHEIRGWTDLKNRLDSDRRCYAFFHPRMPDEPLIFVEIALVGGMSSNVNRLLDENSPLEDPNAADAAIFYSISNAQKGLAGISFGNFLIKTVVDDLAKEFKNLRTFATLSPIPGFMGWLRPKLAEQGDTLLTEAERKALEELLPPDGEKDLLTRALAVSGWTEQEPLSTAIKAPLLRLCAQYLVQEKRGNRALDPVAHFHLSNGARMERLNWLGDLSPKGLRQSAGLMINYLYKLDSIEANHEAYSGEGKIACSSGIRSLVKS
jgi:malonyl-CoA decarboxylase